ncbi:glycoside hydrolase domain-containing protein [Streptomyces sp. NRRL F-5065]|uniref:glycoside hydrolase domain-containing protein n=1 Tax=Streptomyces sp. NRRL F-5065 TaxID=1463855 RepID=UPI0004C07565|nr:glycoside hydrolase domain-containing protein [Streptomyces sp. NRRL F-5065]
MADEKVLAAQRWVNATYGNVPGYAKCPEDGKTGWATMYSLTMGLQYELGISPVVANFGDGTLDKVTALGTIGIGWKKNANIVKIIRHGLFCKGYWGGDTAVAEFDSAAAAAVDKMKENMGLPQDGGVVQARVFKAILNMDAYITVAGGTDKVRSIQQWLNRNYWTKKTFSIGPTDGIYSRDVQQSLMKAIQFAVGIAEADANGNFGPGTQAGIKAHTVGPGSSGLFVQLFSAACVFNEPVPGYGEPNGRTHFTDSWDADIQGWVKAFQTFSQLPVTEKGDYTTWAQLLVSMGDPDRNVTASDTAYTITPSRGARMYADGYRYVGRYINEASTGGGSKMLEPGELDNIFKAGLRVFPIFQDNGRSLSEYYWGNGYKHSQLAHDQAVHFGFNRGTVIYFAVDYDATQEDMPHILEYFRGVTSGLASRGKRYLHGVYGSRNVCAEVTKETYAAYSFVSGMSWGFSGNLGFPLPANWSFNQIKEYQVTNGSDTFWLDRDAHRVGSDDGQKNVNRAVSPAADLLANIDQLYSLAKSYGKGDPNRLITDYYRQKRYAGFEWKSLIGEVDWSFIDYANSRGAELMSDFTDPFTGQTLRPQHLLATAAGHMIKPPLSDTHKANRGDVAGWAGDLMTFYGEWRRDSDSYASGYTYCTERLGKVGTLSSFSFDDLIEDADGFLLAEKMRSGVPITTALRDHYEKTGGVTRFRDYLAKRFGTSQATAADAAFYILTSIDDPLINLGRISLEQQTGGVAMVLSHLLPEDRLRNYCLGFADTLIAHAGLEARSQAKMKSNHARLFADSSA